MKMAQAPPIGVKVPGLFLHTVSVPLIQAVNFVSVLIQVTILGS
ncbi:hypothetical protein CEB3_c11200 [Peptococcaceae bacterium CEB3]|nr:hypothetical protein CEB3_c11200 [Peptococcaceae bacterium CEB3]